LPSDREIALGLWLVAFLVFALSKRGVREASGEFILAVDGYLAPHLQHDEAVRDIFTRVAGGSTLVGEAKTKTQATLKAPGEYSARTVEMCVVS
jgi:hypothetical protein